ncbi:MAG TPA: molybdopterin molybdotransferase MoeA [Bacteroidales bacterium]|nr:molybdopterin molybdotransferase MoeA [Bacteroidales bacterium]HPS17314.1 molybdopterin molybdotransferase MoeA [Bacteroidales bacterium]
MIKFEEAYKIISESVKQLGIEEVSLNDSLNRILAEDIKSDINIPPFNKSAMDGYACRRSDLKNILDVLEIIPAGQAPTKIIKENQCSKIMTGAPVPEGADCVIMVEQTEIVSENKIRFTASDTLNNIAYKAEDVNKGEVVLKKGTLIQPQHIAVLASVGVVKPMVTKQPKVAVISTGDEIIEPNGIPGPSQIRNSNAYQLIAQIKKLNCIPVYMGIAPDDPEKTNKIISEAIKKTDVILLTGGVSMGDFDFIPGILKKKNIDIKFQKILVKPGSPTVFGVSNNCWIFGLPGNPVSTFTIFEMIVKPFLNKIIGNNSEIKNLKFPIAADFKRKKFDRLNWIPVIFNENGEVATIEYHGSGHIHSLCFADGIMIIPFGISEIKKGEPVDVRPL